VEKLVYEKEWYFVRQNGSHRIYKHDPTVHSDLKDGFKINFEVSLESVFELLPEVNITQLAKLAKLGKLNPGLLRQYVSGSKKASEKQAQRVMDAIDKLATKLNSISLTV